ncbi:hypothetical protein LUR56_17485, partial [Streptomyces sp. MT29]|nr:hypothetical protein [Streptomyces sp. MT29]
PPGRGGGRPPPGRGPAAARRRRRRRPHRVAARAALGAAAFSEAYERGARLDPGEAGRQARTAPGGVRPIRG